PAVGGEDPSVGSDHVRDPLRKAVDRHRAESRGDPSIRIRHEVEGKTVLVPKLPVGRLVLYAHAEDHCPGLVKGLRVISKGARLSRTAERGVLRVDIEHDATAAQPPEPDRGPVLTPPPEARGQA